MGDDLKVVEAKVAKLETGLETAQTVSATGQPLVPPKYLPWLLAGYGALVAVTAGLAGILGSGHIAVTVLGIVVAALAPALGIASPGLRRAALVLLCLAPLTLTGCLHLKPGADAKLIACGTDALQSEVAAVMPSVAEALQGTAVDWQHQLDVVVAKAGSAALCALAVLVTNLEVGGGAGQVGPDVVIPGRLPTSVLLTRAYSYQASRPFHSK
jgi:hypothetical protein